MKAPSPPSPFIPTTLALPERGSRRAGSPRPVVAGDRRRRPPPPPLVEEEDTAGGEPERKKDKVFCWFG